MPVPKHEEAEGTQMQKLKAEQVQFRNIYSMQKQKGLHVVRDKKESNFGKPRLNLEW